jgi:uncharacterized protein (TIRG00374 family)
MTTRSKLVLRAGIGISVSVIAMAIALRAVDLGQVADVLGEAAPGWIVLMLGLNLIDVALRGWRWQRLVRPVRSVAYRRMFGYLLIGYLANNVLPARLGELVRSHYLGDREGISRTTALGTVVVERVIDTTFVVLLATGSVLLLSVRGVLASAVLAGLAVAGLLVLGLAALLLAHRLPGADRVLAAIDRFPRIRSLGARLREGLAVVGRPRTLGEAVILTAGAWAASILAFAAAGQAVGVELAMGEAALLSAGVALATIIPSGPGYLGTFELAAVTIAGSIGVPADEAFALALLVHAGILGVTSIGGGIAFLRIGIAEGGRDRRSADPVGWPDAGASPGRPPDDEADPTPAALR